MGGLRAHLSSRRSEGVVAGPPPPPRGRCGAASVAIKEGIASAPSLSRPTSTRHHAYGIRGRARGALYSCAFATNPRYRPPCELPLPRVCLERSSRRALYVDVKIPRRDIMTKVDREPGGALESREPLLDQSCSSSRDGSDILSSRTDRAIICAGCSGPPEAMSTSQHGLRRDRRMAAGTARAQSPAF